uniref:Uncharacterized protein n=2 Tax=Avena sativa TaxID=4498 RepID=A0ACD5ZBS8_AVESA
MVKLVYVFLILFIFYLDKVCKTMCDNPHPQSYMQLQSGEAQPLEGEMIEHITAYQSIGSSTLLYGAMATLDVYESLNVMDGQIASAEIWVENYQKDHSALVNVVQVGWNIQPSYYGDNKTHFRMGWTAGYKSPGCFDLKCDGFVRVKNAPITPGDTLERKSKISIKIFKSKDDGNWWLYFAHVGKKLAPVGYWPKDLFGGLANHANYVTWGGYTRSLLGDPSPLMGNGNWPGENSASFQDVQYVNTDGNVHLPKPIEVHPRETNTGCYKVSEFMADRFQYGGPGGCTS